MCVCFPGLLLTSSSSSSSSSVVRRPPSGGDSSVLMFRDGFTDPDFKDCGDRRLPLIAGPAPTGAPPLSTGLATVRALQPECTSSPPSKEHIDSCSSIQGPNPAPKPKLWSLAEIATSSDKSKGCSDRSQSGGARQQQHPAQPASTLRTTFPHSPTLPRHLYYTAPFIPGYSSYGPLGPLHSSNGSHLNGLQQTMLQRAEAVARDCKLRSHELKKGVMSESTWWTCKDWNHETQTKGPQRPLTFIQKHKGSVLDSVFYVDKM